LQATPTQAQARATFFALAAQAAALPSQRAFDLFVNVTGDPGESIDPKHINWIDADSYTWSVSNSAAPGSSGKPTFADLTFTKSLDKSSPLLFLDLAQAHRITSVVLDLWTSAGTRKSFFKITLTGARITNFSQTASNGQGINETVSLNFDKIKLVYIPQNGAGISLPAVQATWDVIGQRASA
jgi:type VI secretion system secreted protein Hcp